MDAPVQHLHVVTLHLEVSISRRKETMTRLFAAALVVLVWRPRHLGSPPTTPSSAERCWCRSIGRRRPRRCCRCPGARPGPPRAGSKSVFLYCTILAEIMFNLMLCSVFSCFYVMVLSKVWLCGCMPVVSSLPPAMLKVHLGFYFIRTHSFSSLWLLFILVMCMYCS
jgi:hypothetical protein